jgi:hypothetical protein
MLIDYTPDLSSHLAVRSVQEMKVLAQGGRTSAGVLIAPSRKKISHRIHGFMGVITFIA